VARSSPQQRGRSKTAGRSLPAAPLSREDSAIDMGDLPEAIGYMLRRAQLAIFDGFIRSLSTLDLRPSQFSALMIIERNPGLKQTQVSEALGIKRTNLVALIDELERRGLATRRPVPNDRRSYALELTEAGHACLRKARALQAKHEASIAARLGPSGRDTLLRLLRAIVDAPASRDDGRNSG
jgi:DNA-binding MarR family transcriptional regulator